MRNTPEAQAWKSLQQIPGIGPSLARDLIALGYHAPGDLRGEDPEAMYARLYDLTGAHQDRCVLYTLRCAVYYASQAEHESDLLLWWHWTDELMRAREVGNLSPKPAPQVVPSAHSGSLPTSEGAGADSTRKRQG